MAKAKKKRAKKSGKAKAAAPKKRRGRRKAPASPASKIRLTVKVQNRLAGSPLSLWAGKLGTQTLGLVVARSQAQARRKFRSAARSALQR